MRSTIKYILYALAVSPLIVIDSLFFPYISGKNILIRVAVGVAWILFASYLFYAKKFRQEMHDKLKRVLKNPVGLFTTVFMGLLIISTIFAQDVYRAFFGDVERAEGLLNMLFFFGFFVLTALLFERKEWMRFFQISLGVGAYMFLDAFIQFANGVVRPSSTTGNPIYLGEFFLFTILAGVLVFLDTKKEDSVIVSHGWRSFWKIFAAVMVPVSVYGIFISETRGVIVGAAVGLAAVLAYMAIKGKSISIGKTTLQKVSLWAIAVAVVLGGAFYATKHDTFWQKIPGFNRIAAFTFHDPSTETRLISLGVSLHAINPSENSMKEFLIGWGPENFSVAYNAYYNPKYFEYEQLWFDRAHDKLMDVLVMNGVVGLAAYLGIWGSFVWLIFKRKGFSVAMAALLFFGVSYFVQNLTVFDSIVTYPVFFAFLAYLIYCSSIESISNFEFRISKIKEEVQNVVSDSKFVNRNSKLYIVYDAVIGALAIFFAVALIAWTWVPFAQMRDYLNTIQSPGGVQSITNTKGAGVFTPYNYIQELTRMHFLSTLTGQSGTMPQNQWLPAMQVGIAEMADLVAREPWNPRYYITLGQGYEALAQKGGFPQYYKNAEDAYRKAMALSPKRQDTRYLLAYDLALDNQIPAALSLMQETISFDPKVYAAHYYYGLILVTSGEQNYTQGLSELDTALSLNNGAYLNDNTMAQAYYFLLRYYYDKHDAVHSMDAAEGLRKVRPDKAAGIDQIEAFIKAGTWKTINFQ